MLCFLYGFDQPLTGFLAVHRSSLVAWWMGTGVEFKVKVRQARS